MDREVAVNPDYVADLSMRWPWRDSSVDEARAAHVLEHLPGDTFFFFMQELHRVCKPGAKVTVRLPHPRHDIFLNDPTHVRAVMPGTLVMFSKKQIAECAERGIYFTPFCDIYGVDFDLESVTYWFDPGVDKNDPELEWKAKHLNNIVAEWGTVLTVVK